MCVSGEWRSGGQRSWAELASPLLHNGQKREFGDKHEYGDNLWIGMWGLLNGCGELGKILGDRWVNDIAQERQGIREGEATGEVTSD